LLLDTDNLIFVLYSIYLSFAVLVADKRRFPWACLGMDNGSVNIINRIIHGRLDIWNLSSSVHIWYLTCSLRSLIRYQCEHSKINSTSQCAHVLFSIILYTWYWGETTLARQTILRYTNKLYYTNLPLQQM